MQPWKDWKDNFGYIISGIQVLNSGEGYTSAPTVGWSPIRTSRVSSGSVRQTLYSTGAALARCGVIPGFDMTPEAALTKLYCLLAAGLAPAQVRARMQQDLAGELNPT